MSSASRRPITEALQLASQSYWLKKGYSCFKEIGVVAWGRRRADFIALNLRGDIVLCEIKSSVADYTADNKWHWYLEFCNRMMFVMLPDVFDKLRDRMARENVFKRGIGVLVLDPNTGYLRSVKSTKYRPMTGKNKRIIITRLAWRNGVSKANSRRQRQYVETKREVPAKGMSGGTLWSDNHYKKT